MTPASPQKLKVSEAQFQRQVIEFAQRLNWRVAHFRPAQNARGDWRTPVAGDGKGFPDLVLVRERLLFVELKTNTGTLSENQATWRDSLQAAGATWHLWRPKDFDEIQEVLR